MGQLTLYSQFNMRKPFFVSSDSADVAEQLAADRVLFEKWQVKHDPTLCYENEPEAISQYQTEIDKIKADLSFDKVELICACNEEGNAVSLRDRSLSEHTHTEAEVRFFLNGKALIYVHANERIHIIECHAGDFIVIPSGLPHWFDMGPKPNYSCLRWYNSREGTKKHFTGSYMAESTPRWESVLIE